MKGNTFQYIMIGIFAFFLVIGVLVFSGAIKIGSDKAPSGAKGQVTMWGTLSKQDISPLIDEFNSNNETYSVVYVQKSESTFEPELIEALASGTGPDLFMMPDYFLWKHNNKILPISYETITLRDYLDRYIDGMEIFRTPTAIFATPFTVDPMVMYFNRDLVSAAFYDKPPTTWDTMYSFVYDITKRDADNKILTSAIAFGSYENVVHAKDVLAMLNLQIGNKLTVFDGTSLNVDFQLVPTGKSEALTQSALVFYTDFANPATDYYSWNRSLPSDFDSFVSGDLAVYFGYASEVFDIRRKNPNLNFDVAVVPQIKDSASQMTYAKYTGLAVSKQSKNPTTATLVAEQMAGSDFQSKLSEITRLPPVHKALLVADPVDQYDEIFKKSAFISRSWIDPDPAATNTAFKSLVESVLSGRYTIIEAINNFHNTLDSIISS